MNTSLKVLVVEVSQEDLLLLSKQVQTLAREVVIGNVATPKALNKALKETAWDVVVSAYSMPKFDALSALSIVRCHCAEMPFIIVSGSIGEEVAVAAMKAGATDYVMKGNLARLGPVIEREVREAEVRREHTRTIEAFREVNEHNHAIISVALDGIITFDEHGVIQSFNR